MRQIQRRLVAVNMESPTPAAQALNSLDLLIQQLHGCIRGGQFTQARAALTECLAQWPVKKQLIYSLDMYKKRHNGQTMESQHAGIFSLLKPRRRFLGILSPAIIVDVNFFQSLDAVLAAAERTQNILIYSFKNLRQDVHKIKSMIQIAQYDYQIVFPLPLDKKGLISSLRSFLRMHRDPSTGVSLQAEALVFAHGITQTQADNLRAVFDRRTDQHDLLEKFLEQYKGQDPRLLSFAYSVENILTGLRLYHEAIRAVISSHLVSMVDAEQLDKRGVALNVYHERALSCYNYADLIDHNNKVLEVLGDLDLFIEYVYALYTRYNDQHLEAMCNEQQRQDLLATGKSLFKAIITEAKQASQADPLFRKGK